MLLVDIEVPTFSRKYHFTLEESIDVEILITEIVAVIEQKEQCKLKGKRENLMLCRIDTKEILVKNQSLLQQDVKNGDVLLLI